MAICVCVSNPVLAQDSAQREANISPSAVDHAAAAEATIVYRHAKPANTPAGATLKMKDIAAARELLAAHATSNARANSGVRANSPASANSTAAADNDGLRFPGDLSYLGGAVVPFAESHPVYLMPQNGSCNRIGPCFGNPEGFLRDLAISDFAHVLDQYIGLSASNRYTLGSRAQISYKPTPKTQPLTDADLQAFVHSVTSKTHQTGYGHIYHVFLPPGQDICFTATDGACYSPDVPDTFAFCGYHSSVDFSASEHVLYTVEPFQDVAGCSVRPGTPHGQLIDSTNNTLSHETFETITDPDGDAWINFSLVVLAGAEIGDECSFFVIIPISAKQAAAFFDPSVFTIGKNRYAVQPEYSNMEHACATSP